MLLWLTEYLKTLETAFNVFQYITCILCASCYSACPVASRDGRYIGPAALAKLYRFAIDPRDQRPFAALDRVNGPDGVWGCDTVFRCNDVCPKDVRPADGIEGLRALYVALTRATKTLVVVHAEPLPAELGTA